MDRESELTAEAVHAVYQLGEVGVYVGDVHQHNHCEHILQYALCYLDDVYVVLGTDTANLVENAYCVLAYDSYDCSHNYDLRYRSARRRLCSMTIL